MISVSCQAGMASQVLFFGEDLLSEVSSMINGAVSGLLEQLFR